MAEPAHTVLSARTRQRPLAESKAAVPKPPAGLSAMRVRDLPAMPLATLLSLTHEDLPGWDEPDVSESLRHSDARTTAKDVVRRLLDSRGRKALLATDLTVYGKPAAADRLGEASIVKPLVAAPDLLVVLDVAAPADLGSYVLWDEGKAPDFVLEVASKWTWRVDRDRKPEVYASMGVREYFLYDPTGEWLKPALQGYALRRGGYQRLPQERLPNGATGVRSQVLEACPFLRALELRWWDARTECELETSAEAAAREAVARKAAEARAEEESASRAAAEAEIAQLRARLRRLSD